MSAFDDLSLTRRRVLAAAGAGAAALGTAPAIAQARKTFVLIHGAYHGGWCWRRVADRLERQGLLRRERCESDARGLFAEITPDGRRLFDTARQTHLDGVRKLCLGRFSRAELRMLGALWQKLGD